MKLSVIIVNYNVKLFLDQCLTSVFEASKGVDMEVFVVDNNSVDGSVLMVQQKYPEVKLICNTDNRGFSKANNQAIEQSKGEYVLLLNPDTVVEEDTFRKTVQFMDEHPDAGGLGVKMLDGKGRFLPESKRGLPTPSVAFYKIFGLANIFPKSEIFGRYHLGFLDKNKIHKVDVLSGAYMLMRKSALAKTGLLDETFFMYGEDIDLSYRIKLAGFENYYFPETRIIHYKGESTKKSSINYVFVFYNAMIIFAQKHFSQKNARLFSFFINLAIYFRASVSVISRFVKRSFVLLADIAIIFAGIFFLKYLWEQYLLKVESDYYPSEFLTIAIPCYIAIWLISIFFAGGYDKPIKTPAILKGILFGTLIILVIYSLLPENLRFSRALILFGAVWASISLPLYRIVFNKLKFKEFYFENDKIRSFAIVGSIEECQNVSQFLKNTQIIPQAVLFISQNEKQNNPDYQGTLSQLSEIIQINKIDEVIYCAKDLKPATIIESMSILQDKNIDFKIAPPESLYIIGSNSIHTSGDLYTIDLNAISKSSNKRNKRTFDIFASLILLIISPVLFVFIKNRINLIRNIINVLLNKKTWIGFNPEYIKNQSIASTQIPKIKQGVLFPTDLFNKQNLEIDAIHRLNVMYARDYKVITDAKIIFKNTMNLSRS
ncbi:MAG: glycosyltransferase [Bacteroidota bacterium]